MSAAVPHRQIASRCLFSTSLPIRSRALLHQRRTATSDASNRGGNDGAEQSAPSRQRNPVLEEFQRQNPTMPNARQQQMDQMIQAQRTPGDLGASSIFEDERRTRRQQERQATGRDQEEEKQAQRQAQRDPANMRQVLDPDPNARERWERKKVIQAVRRGGRLTHTQRIVRTERQHLAKSHNLKTSVKKLGMLARQIAGKTVDDAIEQMRFSKKGAAVEVLKQLEYARDEAIVMRGMGLDHAGGEHIEASALTTTAAATSPALQEKALRDKTSASADSAGTNPLDTNPLGTDPLGGSALLQTPTLTPTASTTTSSGAAPIDIQLKSGQRHTVTDRSKIYIAQAWVGRGPYGKLPDYRARGRVNIMRTPWTSISVLLKEERTRVREWQEREAKRTRRRLDNGWAPLPDKPIRNRSQWFSW